MENLIDFIKLAYSDRMALKEEIQLVDKFTVGVDCEGEFGVYANNHSDNWIALGNLKVMYDEIKRKFDL